MENKVDKIIRECEEDIKTTLEKCFSNLFDANPTKEDLFKFEKMLDDFFDNLDQKDLLCEDKIIALQKIYSGD